MSSSRSPSRIGRSGIGRRSTRAPRFSTPRWAGRPWASTGSRLRSLQCTTASTRAEDTDWTQILALYGLLEQLTDNPVVTVNRAVAVAMAEGPSAGLVVLDSVDERLAGHYRVDAIRAHLLEMTGDTEGAVEHYRAAAGRTTSLPEQRYLSMKAARLKQGETEPSAFG